VRIAASDVRERMHGCHRQGRLNAAADASGRQALGPSEPACSISVWKGKWIMGAASGSQGLRWIKHEVRPCEPSWFRVRARGSGFLPSKTVPSIEIDERTDLFLCSISAECKSISCNKAAKLLLPSRNNLRNFNRAPNTLSE
jgi:hypothetical protein